MLSKIHLENVGVLRHLDWAKPRRVNVIVGENDTGKSYLLKALYVVVKSIEETQRRWDNQEGDDERIPSWDLLARKVVGRKLRSTFQPTKTRSALIRRGTPRLSAAVEIDGCSSTLSLTRRSDVATAVRFACAPVPEDVNAVFIPPKEVLTAFSAIAVTREKLEIRGFDDTYYDVIKLLRVPATQGEIDSALADVLQELAKLFSGQILKKESSDDFTFKRGKRSFGMTETADGIKKVSILTSLIKNRCLSSSSILFVDEPETNLHPGAIVAFTKALFRLGEAGVQVFLATHSYLVIKQLQILAKEQGERVPFCSLVRKGDGVEAELSDLRDGMPENPIVDVSVELYKREIEVDRKLALGGPGARRARGVGSP